MQHNGNANFHSVYNKVSTPYLWSYKVDHFYVANAVQRPKTTEGMNTKGMVTYTMRKNFLCWVQDSFTEQAFDRSKKQVIISIANVIIIIPSNAFLFLILQLHVIIHKGRHILISCCQNLNHNGIKFALLSHTAQNRITHYSVFTTTWKWQILMDTVGRGGRGGTSGSVATSVWKRKKRLLPEAGSVYSRL